MFRAIGVKVTKNNERILKGISVEVQKAEFVNILGPSGGGKTTFLRTLNGLEDYQEGEIYYENQPMTQLDPIQLRKEVGYVFQTPYLFGENVRDNIEYPIQLHNIQYDNQYINRLLDRLNLKVDILDKKCTELSGGEQQRISLIRSLVLKPKILLLDEVTASLDPISTKLVEELIKELNQNEKTTIIMVTHQIEQAKRMGKRIIFIADGEIIQDTETEEFFALQSNEAIQKFIQKAE